MNFRTEITLEILRDNLAFRFVIPFGTAYETAHDVCLKMAEGIKEMQRQHDAQKAAASQQQQSSTESTVSPEESTAVAPEVIPSENAENTNAAN